MALRVGIALEGGGMRCAAQAGALMVLMQAGIQPACYAGCGTGALIAALAASGELSEKALHPFQAAASYNALFRNMRLNRCLHNQFSNLILREMPPLAMPTVDLETGIVQVLASMLPIRSDPRPWSRQALLYTAVRAAMATPGVLPPVNWRSRMLAGGDLLRNTLPAILHAMGADVSVCIRVLDAGCAQHETKPAALAICANAIVAAPPHHYDLLMTLGNYEKGYSVLGKQDVQALYGMGMVAAQKMMPSVKVITGQLGAKILQFPGLTQ